MLALVCFFYARFSSASCASSCFPVQVSKLWNCFGLCFFQEVSLRADTKYIHKTYLWLFTGMRHKRTECILLQSDQLWQTQSLSSYPSLFLTTVQNMFLQGVSLKSKESCLHCYQIVSSTLSMWFATFANLSHMQASFLLFLHCVHTQSLKLKKLCSLTSSVQEIYWGTP